jgi:hypothetical protein
MAALAALCPFCVRFVSVLCPFCVRCLSARRFACTAPSPSACSSVASVPSAMHPCPRQLPPHPKSVRGLPHVRQCMPRVLRDAGLVAAGRLCAGTGAGTGTITGVQELRESSVGAIARYVRWVGHDAGGALAPQDVAAGILHRGAWHLPGDAPPLAADEVLVLVPPQWIGDWENGYPLAPGYQHIWRVPIARLQPLPQPPLHGPYRPDELPPSATGPSRRLPWRRRAAS